MHSLPRFGEKNWPKANIPCMEPLGILYYQFINILDLTMAIEIPEMKNMLLALNLAIQLPSFFCHVGAVESGSLYKDGAPIRFLDFGKYM